MSLFVLGVPLGSLIAVLLVELLRSAGLGEQQAELGAILVFASVGLMLVGAAALMLDRSTRP